MSGDRSFGASHELTGYVQPSTSGGLSFSGEIPRAMEGGAEGGGSTSLEGRGPPESGVGGGLGKGGGACHKEGRAVGVVQ